MLQFMSPHMRQGGLPCETCSLYIASHMALVFAASLQQDFPPVYPYIQYIIIEQWVDKTASDPQHLPCLRHLVNASVFGTSWACGKHLGTWMATPAAARPASGADGIIWSLYPLVAAVARWVPCVFAGAWCSCMQ